MPEARIEPTQHGLIPAERGWHVLNLAQCAWKKNERFGTYALLEGPQRFQQLGVNVHVLQPEQAACLYHAESQEEAFLVLEGEALLLVDGEERRLSRWDFVFCPPGVPHVFIGAGEGPCALLMMGSRSPSASVTYPKNELAASHQASADRTVGSPAEAYAGSPPWEWGTNPWPLRPDDGAAADP
ncbi:MAG: cupin domain-containing protein [Acidobacteriota bacterium]